MSTRARRPPSRPCTPHEEAATAALLAVDLTVRAEYADDAHRIHDAALARALASDAAPLGALRAGPPVALAVGERRAYAAA